MCSESMICCGVDQLEQGERGVDFFTAVRMASQSASSVGWPMFAVLHAAKEDKHSFRRYQRIQGHGGCSDITGGRHDCPHELLR